jgi:hypothetical protein
MSRNASCSSLGLLANVGVSFAAAAAMKRKGRVFSCDGSFRFGFHRDKTPSEDSTDVVADAAAAIPSEWLEPAPLASRRAAAADSAAARSTERHPNPEA